MQANQFNNVTPLGLTTLSVLAKQKWLIATNVMGYKVGAFLIYVLHSGHSPGSFLIILYPDWLAESTLPLRDLLDLPRVVRH